MGLHIQVVHAGTRQEINAAFATFARNRPNALFVSTDTFFTTRHDAPRDPDGISEPRIC